MSEIIKNFFRPFSIKYTKNAFKFVEDKSGSYLSKIHFKVWAPKGFSVLEDITEVKNDNYEFGEAITINIYFKGGNKGDSIDKSLGSNRFSKTVKKELTDRSVEHKKYIVVNFFWKMYADGSTDSNLVPEKSGGSILVN